MSVSDNILSLKRRIAEACRRSRRRPEEITLVAVSKGFGTGPVREALKAGVEDFGENRWQEAEPKLSELESSELRWHFIGRLQSNKLGKILDSFDVVQSFDSLELLSGAQAHLKARGRKLEALLQVNISREVQKGGFDYAAAGRFFAQGGPGRFPNLRIRGLMGIGPAAGGPQASRKVFREFRAAFDAARRHDPALDILSMGMSGDFEAAIEEGTTMVRVGTAIFGKRK